MPFRVGDVVRRIRPREHRDFGVEVIVRANEERGLFSFEPTPEQRREGLLGTNYVAAHFELVVVTDDEPDNEVEVEAPAPVVADRFQLFVSEPGQPARAHTGHRPFDRLEDAVERANSYSTTAGRHQWTYHVVPLRSVYSVRGGEQV